MTYVDHVLRVLATEPGQEVLIDGNRRLTRAQARDLLLRYADGLHARGVRPGDGVAVFTGNTVGTALVNLAIHLLGCRLVFVPPEPGERELRALVDKADVKVTVIDPAFDDRLPGVHLDDLPGEPVEREGVPGIGTVMYTGGTTGSPKLVSHSGRIYEVLTMMGATPPGNVLVGTLITHATGHVNSLLGLVSGSKVVLGPSPFDAGEVARLVREERITRINMVPPMLYELLDHPDCPGRDVFERVGLGGSALAPTRLQQALDRFGPVVWNGYGMTEAWGVSAMNPAELTPDTMRSVGRPFPGTEIRIVDGDIHLRGGSLMTGYWGEPPVDGWFNTGDVGHLDDNGHLYLDDRSKDVIVTGRTSDNVYSRLLDDFLVTLPGISQAAAVGAPDEAYGEVVHVFVVPRPGHEVDTTGLRNAVVAELGELYEPQGVTVLDRLPSTRVGKVDKKALRSTLA